VSYRLNPDRNLPWNDLPDLPIAAEAYETLEVYKQLGNAKEALGRLQGRSIAIPDQGLLINSISLQEAKASSEVENIFTTDDELYKAFSQTKTTALQGPVKEVLNYREALWAGMHALKQHGSFTFRYFEQLYQTVTGFSDGIRPPQAQTYIRQGGSGPNAGKAIYTPPRGKGILEGKLQNLITFLNSDAESGIDPLLKMAMAHYQFEAIHPFRDGNGRVGRLLNIHYLTQSQLLEYPILYLSRFVLENKEDYYACLAGVSQRAAWEKWLLFMLAAVEQTANQTYQKINDILASRDSVLQLLQTEMDIARPEVVVQAIFTQPYTRVKHLEGAFAENTARKYLDQLAEAHILEKRMAGGSAYYLNLELFRILSE